jgi:polyferredoxin
MVLDTLPYRSGGGWRKGLARIRVVHFVLSLALVAVVYFMLRRSVIHTDPEALKKGMGTFPELVWFLSGNALYYMAGIGLAIGFRDNRAFCKYLCPITVFLRLTNRVTLTRIKGDKATCTSCGTCTARCPMSIDIPAYVKAEERVASTECIVCMNCVAACPEGALKTSIGLDLARRDLLRGDESLAVLGGSQAGAAGEAGGEIGGRGEPAVQGNFRN